MMKPAGNGPFPLVLLAHMNGGQATQWLREWPHYGNWTPEQLVKAGYAVAWMRYRAEVNNVYGPAMRETARRRQLLIVAHSNTTTPYLSPDIRKDAPVKSTPIASATWG